MNSATLLWLPTDICSDYGSSTLKFKIVLQSGPTPRAATILIVKVVAVFLFN
jgi:hypothetical protein